MRARQSEALLVVFWLLAAACGGNDGAGLNGDASPGAGGSGPGRGGTKPGEPGTGGATGSGGSGTAGTGGSSATGGAGGSTGGSGPATGGAGGAGGAAGMGGSGTGGAGGSGGSATGGSGMDAPVDRPPDVAVDRPPDVAPDMQPNPCTSGGVCEMINREYMLALNRSRACTAGAAGQCAEKAAQGLMCPGCQVWVNTRRELDPLVKRYADEGCPDKCRLPCPLPPCRLMVKGACVAASSQATNDPDRIVAPPQGGYVCTEAGLSTMP